MDYAIWINNKKVPVSKAVYSAYWKGARKERYFSESDIHNHVFSYDALDQDDMNGEDIFTSATDIPVDEQVIASLENQQLYDAIAKLSSEDYNIIYKLYFCNISLRKLAAESGVALSTLHYRHHAILLKLRRYMTPQPNL